MPSGLTGLDRAVYLSIRGRRRAGPADLVDIISDVDAQQKLSLDALGYDFSLPLTIVWAVPDGSYPTDSDADAAIPLMEAIERAIGPTGLALPAGFEYGAGKMTMFLWADRADVRSEDVYAIVAPIVCAFPMPVGSRIVRDPDTDGEIVSDIVTTAN